MILDLKDGDRIILKHQDLKEELMVVIATEEGLEDITTRFKGVIE